LTVDLSTELHAREDPKRRARGRDLTLHATILALLLWGAVGADLLSPGPYGRFSRLQKGNDFVVFYTLGSLVKSGDFKTLEDDPQFRRAQLPYLSPTAQASYPAVYGPQIGVALAPLAWLPYLMALTCWNIITIAGILWCVRRCWRACPPLYPWWPPVRAVGAAFPPFAYLVLAGQLSLVAVVALTLVVTALTRGSKVLAGAALGILGYKVSLLIPALAVCVLAGEGTIVLVAVLVAAGQLIAVIPIVGPEVVGAFIGNTVAAGRAPDALAVTPALMFSLRTLWSRLLPHEWVTAGYGLSAILTWALTARGWRRTGDPLRRVALLAIATALTAPHLFLYDLVILIPAFVASGGILVERRAPALRWTTTLAFLSPCFSPPIAYLANVQVATVVLAAWLVALVHASTPTPHHPATAR
jgi:hypothetical protein